MFYINSHLSEHSPLANCQWGFQKGKSTVSALLHVTHDWFQHLERNHEVGAVFFDFHKAFDSVPHEPLLSKLKALNLTHNVYVWLHNYLAGRQQKVVLNGVSSETSPVTSGVPQGSILGPILFLIYINDIVKANISKGSTLVLYADDILLYRPICTSEDYFFLQRDIDSISNWASTNKMTFNTSKCKSMLISRKGLIVFPLHLYISMALHLKLSQLSSTLVFLCLPVCSGHLTYRKFAARLAKSLVFCIDDTTNILTLPPCFTFTSHLSDPTQSTRLKFGTHICIKILTLSRTSRSLHCGFAAKTGTWDTLSYWTCVRCPPSRIGVSI